MSNNIILKLVARVIVKRKDRIRDAQIGTQMPHMGTLNILVQRWFLRHLNFPKGKS